MTDFYFTNEKTQDENFLLLSDTAPETGPSADPSGGNENFTIFLSPQYYTPTNWDGYCIYASNTSYVCFDPSYIAWEPKVYDSNIGGPNCYRTEEPLSSEFEKYFETKSSFYANNDNQEITMHPKFRFYKGSEADGSNAAAITPVFDPNTYAALWTSPETFVAFWEDEGTIVLDNEYLFVQMIYRNVNGYDSQGNDPPHYTTNAVWGVGEDCRATLIPA